MDRTVRRIIKRKRKYSAQYIGCRTCYYDSVESPVSSSPPLTPPLVSLSLNPSSLFLASSPSLSLFFTSVLTSVSLWYIKDDGQVYKNPRSPVLYDGLFKKKGVKSTRSPEVECDNPPRSTHGRRTSLGITSVVDGPYHTVTVKNHLPFVCTYCNGGRRVGSSVEVRLIYSDLRPLTPSCFLGPLDSGKRIRHKVFLYWVINYKVRIFLRRKGWSRTSYL